MSALYDDPVIRDVDLLQPTTVCCSCSGGHRSASVYWPQAFQVREREAYSLCQTCDRHACSANWPLCPTLGSFHMLFCADLFRPKRRLCVCGCHPQGPSTSLLLSLRKSASHSNGFSGSYAARCFMPSRRCGVTFMFRYWRVGPP